MSDKLHNQLRLLDTAIARLEKALARPVDEFVLDSAIQRFEFTFELLWKSVKTYAEEAGGRSVFASRQPSNRLSTWYH